MALLTPEQAKLEYQQREKAKAEARLEREKARPDADPNIIRNYENSVASTNEQVAKAQYRVDNPVTEAQERVSVKKYEAEVAQNKKEEAAFYGADKTDAEFYGTSKNSTTTRTTTVTGGAVRTTTRDKVAADGTTVIEKGTTTITGGIPTKTVEVIDNKTNKVISSETNEIGEGSKVEPEDTRPKTTSTRATPNTDNPDAVVKPVLSEKEEEKLNPSAVTDKKTDTGVTVAKPHDWGTGGNEGKAVGVAGKGSGTISNKVGSTGNEGKGVGVGVTKPHNWGTDGREGRSAGVPNAIPEDKGTAVTAGVKKEEVVGDVITYTKSDNILFDYATYTYNLSLHAIPVEEFNEMILLNQSTGYKYKPTNVIIASAGRGSTAPGSEFKRNPEFDVDFYFDNLKMTTIIGLNQRSRMTNAIDISFTIIEPFGVTLLNRLIRMAEVLKVPNYTQMPYMLQIDFYGTSDQDDKQAGVPRKIEGVTKFIPIRIIGFKIKVTNKGGEYQIQASPFNHQAFSETVINTPAAFEVNARTIKDFFDIDGLDKTDITAEIASHNVTEEEKQRLTSYESQRAAFRNLKPEEQTDVRKGEIAKIDAEDKTLQDQIRTRINKAVNVNSLTRAYNSWLEALSKDGKQKSFDSIRFEVDDEIAKALVVPPPLDPASTSPMDYTKTVVTPAETVATSPTLTTKLSNLIGETITRVSGTAKARKQLLEDGAKAAGMSGRELAAFMAQCDAETGGFVYMSELWGPTPAQVRYDDGSARAVGMGNTQPGDGKKYRGRGFIQLTWKSNYAKYGPLVGEDLVNNPELAADPTIALRIAVAFWHTATREGSTCAQAAQNGDFQLVTRIINGGTNGKVTRDQNYARYLNIYGGSSSGISVGSATPPVPAIQRTSAGTPANAAPGTRAYPIPAGKTIVDVISEVVRNSTYIRDQITDPKYKQMQISENSEKVLEQLKVNSFKWFTIIPEIKLIPPFDKTRNTFAKQITYYIKPTHVVSTIPESKMGLPVGVAKQYSYIFTGENRDVIDFTLDFDCLYFTARTAIAENQSKTSTRTQETPVPNKPGNTGVAEVYAVMNKTNAESKPVIIQVQPSAEIQIQQSKDATAVIISDINRSLLSSSRGELVQVMLKIVGDPDFIKQDDLFYGPNNLKKNAENGGTDLSKVQKTQNGSLIMDNGTVPVGLIFQTPSDYDEHGIAIPNGKYMTSVFSGVYKVLQVENNFAGGKFEQTLTLIRLYEQPVGWHPSFGEQPKPKDALTQRDKKAEVNDTPAQVAVEPKKTTEKPHDWGTGGREGRGVGVGVKGAVPERVPGVTADGTMENRDVDPDAKLKDDVKEAKRYTIDDYYRDAEGDNKEIAAKEQPTIKPNIVTKAKTDNTAAIAIEQKNIGDLTAEIAYAKEELAREQADANPRPKIVEAYSKDIARAESQLSEATKNLEKLKAE